MFHGKLRYGSSIAGERFMDSSETICVLRRNKLIDSQFPNPRINGSRAIPVAFSLSPCLIDVIATNVREVRVMKRHILCSPALRAHYPRSRV